MKNASYRFQIPGLNKIRALPLWQKVILLLLLAGNLVYYCLVFAFFKGDCIIDPHDYLDHINAWLQMFRENGLFLSVNEATPCFMGLSTTNYAFISFSFQSLLFAVCENFTAFALSYIIAFLLGFIGMAILLEEILEDNTFLSLIVAMLYAALPLGSNFAIAIATMPYFLLAVYRLYPAGKPFDKRVLLLLFFPFFSQLTFCGIFLMAILVFAIVIHLFRERILPVNLLVGFCVLCVGFIAVEWRLFYSVLFGGPLNRSIYSIESKPFLSQFLSYFRNGHYHAESLQDRLIFPLVLLLSASLLFLPMLNRAGFKRRLSLCSRRDGAMLLCTVALIILFAAVSALYDTKILDSLIRKLLPFLAGFNWGRFWVLNRALWYIAFAVCLKILWHLPKLRFISLSLALLQMGYIAVLPWPTYAYASKTWINEMLREPMRYPANDGYISYDAFYAVELFSQIKTDLAYEGENVAAVGYHPAVLMFNGFHCIDGYLNSYELSYMQKFRTLIAPELEQNEDKRRYYDSWGGRMYLYNEEAPYAPTWDRVTEPITLRIDPVVMRQTFDLRYLLSRAPIGNQEELGISLLHSYHTNDLYDIYVYKVD